MPCMGRGGRYRQAWAWRPWPAAWPCLMRPQGIVAIHGQRYEAVSRSGMLGVGTGVRVCAVAAARLEVEAMEEGET